MLTLLAAHAALAVSLPLAAGRLGRYVWLLAALAPAAVVGWAVAHTPQVLAGGTAEEQLTWAPALRLDIVLQLDGLSLLMVYLVGVVGTGVMLYSARYFGRSDAGREAGLQVAFAATMFGLVVADQLITLYIFWELTTVVSFLLIAGRGQGVEHRRAAQQALLTTAAGGLAMLFGFLLLGEQAGTYRISAIVAAPPEGGAVTAAVVLTLVGAFAKSALLPFSAWLPAAMVAPTPVSAYLHAAAMVKAGVYLVARFAPAFAVVLPWRPAVLGVGLATMVLAAWRALRQYDLKQLLAFGTVSELGLLVALLGTGTRVAALAGTVLLLAHASFKSALFLCVGIIDRQAGTRDLRRLSGVGRRGPGLVALAVPAVASMAGLPPLVGYLSKEAAYEAFLHGDFPGHAAALAGLCAGSALTAAYSARFAWGAFADKPDVASVAEVRPGPVLAVPTAVLSAAGLVLGVWYPATASLVEPYVTAGGLSPGGGWPYQLKLWHGWTLTLLLSAVMLGLGFALHRGRAAVAAVRGRLPRAPDPQRGYQLTVRAVDRLALGLTRRTQVGSLPVYLTVLLATVLLLPGVTLALRSTRVPAPQLWHSAVQVPLAVIVLGAAAALTGCRHRLTAVLLVGAIGYGVAGLFLVHGAPDLALVQFLVESLTLVVIVLVLRRLPARFTSERRRPSGGWLRIAVASAVGVFFGFFAVWATSSRSGTSEVAAWYLRHADQAGAPNTVNAIIVDFRALDTLGEAAVLLVTVIGVAALVGFQPPDPLPSATAGIRRGEPAAQPARAARWDVPQQPWLPEARELPRHERSVLLEVVSHLLFPSVLLLSVYLLFAGHYRPGGGFAGGLVAGQAFVLRHLVGGRADRAFALPVNPRMVAGSGLAVAATAALAPLAFGGEPLSSAKLSFPLPPIGPVEFASSVFFDLGVYLLVIGFCLMLLAAAARARADTDQLQSGGVAP